MKKIAKSLILAAGIGAVTYMAQMGQRDSEKLRSILDGINPFNRNKDKVKKEKVKSNQTNACEKTMEEDFVKSDEEKISSEIIEISKKTLEDELQDGKELFSFLLPLTKRIAVKNAVDETLDYSYVLQGWEDALAGDCEIMKTEFDFLLQEVRKPLDEISAEEAAVVFFKWLDYLENLGIHEYSDESLDENSNVTVSIKNRKFYINGRNFKDGSVCAIERKPWVYNDEVYFDGILCNATEKEETAEEPDEVKGTNLQEEK